MGTTCTYQLGHAVPSVQDTGFPTYPRSCYSTHTDLPRSFAPPSLKGPPRPAQQPPGKRTVAIRTYNSSSQWCRAPSGRPSASGSSCSRPSAPAASPPSPLTTIECPSYISVHLHCGVTARARPHNSRQGARVEGLTGQVAGQAPMKS